MTNIWGFLNQTLTVSIVAAVLLIIKHLLNDKLSPRWQYGIWSIFALRLLLPVNVRKMVFLPVSYWIEIIKAMVEGELQSAYAAVYEPVALNSIVPSIISKPESVMDWIFVIYILGILVCMLRYLLSFLSLRWKLRKEQVITKELAASIQEICDKYHLKACRTIRVKGIQTAFVCAGSKNILVLPADEEWDQNVILHELMHLKYHDQWQTVFWCVLRCLHWCNPFLWYVFARIENDMETLCDQRVLECLEGEERRTYGMTLLQMANEKYARVPGTSSISNGGANIKRRIESIVRFKKYPKGMALVSICIAVVFLFPVIGGTSFAYDTEVLRPRNERELERGLALSRINRCLTLPGAIDTYAKGLMHNNGIYIAIASPLEKQKELAEHMYGRVGNLDQQFIYDSGEEFEFLKENNYHVQNIKEVGEDKYTALLVFYVYSYDEESHRQDESLIVPVRVWYEESWVVEECAERKVLPGNILDLRYDDAYKDFFAIKTYQAKGKTGTATARMSNEARVNNWVPNQISFFGMGTYSSDLKLDAVFDQLYLEETVEYNYVEDEGGNTPKFSFGIQTAGLEAKEQAEEIPIEKLIGNGGGSTSGGGFKYGHSWSNRQISEENKDDRTIQTGGGAYTMYNVEEFEMEYPEAYLVRVYWDGKIVEELILE